MPPHSNCNGKSSMLRTAFSSSLALAGLALALSGTANAAGTTVEVTLWDKGSAAPMMTGLGMGMDGYDPSKHPMGIKLSTSTVKAGEVTFAVQNSSSDFVHEMVVMPVRNQAKPFPYVADENRIDEDAAGHLGEVSELDPGKSGALTLQLKPGIYALICNAPGHYM